MTSQVVKTADTLDGHVLGSRGIWIAVGGGAC